MVRFTQSGMLGHSERAQDSNVDPGFLSRFAHRRFLDGLALVDAAARHDGCELGLAGNVEDKELVCAGLRVLTGDVDDDVRPNGQLVAPASWLCGRAWRPGSLEGFLRVDVADRRVGRNEPFSRLHAEPLRKHRAERDHLHVPEAGEASIRLRRSTESLASRHSREASPPYSSSTRAQSSCTRAAIEPGKRCDGRLLAEGGLDLPRVEPCDLECAQPLLDLQRAQERGLDRPAGRARTRSGARVDRSR